MSNLGLLVLRLRGAEVTPGCSQAYNRGRSKEWQTAQCYWPAQSNIVGHQGSAVAKQNFEAQYGINGSQD